MVQCYRCGIIFSPSVVALRAWAESGRPFDPTDWNCDDCRREEDSGGIPVKCPKCGVINRESAGGLHYDCACGAHYDFNVCDHCQAEIGIYIGDRGVCPACGKPYTGDNGQ